MTDPDNAKITYTVRELLEGIKRDQTEGFTRIEASMAGKADKADVARLETRLDHHGKRLDEHGGEIATLKQARRDEKARVKRSWTLRQKLLAGLGSSM